MASTTKPSQSPASSMYSSSSTLRPPYPNPRNALTVPRGFVQHFPSCHSRCYDSLNVAIDDWLTATDWVDTDELFQAILTRHGWANADEMLQSLLARFCGARGCRSSSSTVAAECDSPPVETGDGEKEEEDEVRAEVGRQMTTAEWFPGLSGNELYAALSGVDLYPSSSSSTGWSSATMVEHREYVSGEEEEEGGEGQDEPSRRKSFESVSSYASTTSVVLEFGEGGYERCPDGKLRRKLGFWDSLRTNLEWRIGRQWRKRKCVITEPARNFGAMVARRFRRKATKKLS